MHASFVKGGSLLHAWLKGPCAKLASDQIVCVCVFGSLPGVTWTGPGLVHRQLHAACGNATITNGPLHGWGKTIIAKKSPQKSWTPFFCYPRIHGSWSQYAVLLRYEGSVGEPHGRGRG